MTVVEQFVRDTQDLLKQNNITVLEVRPLSWCYRLSLSQFDQQVYLNIYYNKKNHFKLMIGSQTFASPAQVVAYLTKQFIKVDDQKSWQTWLGCDESGKGDFFGPLVVSAFYCRQEDSEVLVKLGVADSKTFKDPDIISLAHKLYKNYPDNIKAMVLYPTKYNELYQKFTDQNKKLNEMLAWMHSRLIVDFSKEKTFEAVLVDKFMNEEKFSQSLKELSSLNLIHQERAEANPAVAAASIIARYHFLMSMQKMRAQYKINFPKGCNPIVITIAQEFIKLYGIDRLGEVAKTHFSTYEKLVTTQVLKL